MDYLRGFKVFRDDPEWTQKLLVGSVLFASSMVIPILGQVVLAGWASLAMRKAVRGDMSLPRLEFDMDYLGKLLGIGFKGFIARFVWQLPVMFLSIALFLCMYFAMFAAIIAAAEGGGGGGGGGLIGCCVCGAVLFAYPLMIIGMLPAIVASMRAELTDKLEAGLAFKEVLDFTKAMFSDLFKGSIIIWLASLPLVFIGIITCYIGLMPAVVVMTFAHAHFMAQVYEKWVAEGGEPLDVAAGEV